MSKVASKLISLSSVVLLLYFALSMSISAGATFDRPIFPHRYASSVVYKVLAVAVVHTPLSFSFSVIQCCVCTLQLNSSSHIARSHHHLFPVPSFEEYELQHHEDSSSTFVPVSVSAPSDRYTASPSTAPPAALESVDDKIKETLESSSAKELTLSSGEMQCAGCLVGFLQSGGLLEKKIVGGVGVEDVSIFRCPRCRSLFCSVCDAFIHESLHNCPCCSSDP